MRMEAKFCEKYTKHHDLLYVFALLLLLLLVRAWARHVRQIFPDQRKS